MFRDMLFFGGFEIVCESFAASGWGIFQVEAERGVFIKNLSFTLDFRMSLSKISPNLF